MMTIKQLIAYLKDNPNHYWFRRKVYGFGWTPATWQGWVTIAFLALAIISDSLALKADPSDSQASLFVVEVLLAVVIIIVICYIKGEKPGWKWGLTPEEKEKYNK